MRDNISTPAVTKKIDGVWTFVKIKDLDSATVRPITSSAPSSAPGVPNQSPTYRKAAG